VIRLAGIGKTYRSGEVEFQALKDVDVTIERGEYVAILGASGSGKSTLMNLVGCLDRPTTGKYFLDGTDVSQMSRTELAHVRNQKLGFVFQSFNLLRRTTALENVELPLLYRRGLSSAEKAQRARGMLQKVGLADKERSYPSQMSGGQQQRVAIARALVNEPAVLLADEPTGNLDSQTSLEIMNLFRGLNESGLTVVLVTHEYDIARFAKRHITLRDGRVISDILWGQTLKESVPGAVGA